MKKILILITIILFSGICNSQTNEFPLGIYIADADTATRFANGDYPGIKELGVNLVVQYASNNPSNKDSLSYLDNLIALNADDSLDYIHHYTAGYYSKWQAEETVQSSNTPGFKTNSSTTGSNSTSYRMAEVETSTVGKYLLLGPDYDQNRKYRLLYSPFRDSTIIYRVNYRLKIDGNTTQAVDVCIISVKYTSSEGNDTTIVSDTLQANVMYNQFTNHSLVYSLPESITGTKIPKNQTAEFSVRNDGALAGSAESYTGPYGVQFNVKWLGNRNLYVDYIEVFDDLIGSYFTSPINIQTIADQCSTYAANYSNWSNLKYWYSLDEPHSIDNYEPYRIVDSILTAVSNTRLITAFYPEWNGIRNHEDAMGDFVDRADPYKTMPYYYPYWPGADKHNHDGLFGQKGVLQAPFLNNGYDVGDYWFIAQAMGFWDVDENDDLVPVRRRVKPAEMNASVMLALALGAKGIVFWNYYSYYNSNNRYRCYGIVKARDSLYAKTDLYYKIKNDIAPRLKGTLGNTLKKLKYEGYYAHKIYGLGNIASIDNLDYLSMNSTATDSANFHAGLLVDSVITDKQYYMIVNLIAFDSSMNRDLIIEVKNPLSHFSNYILKNIESDYNYDKIIDLSGSRSFADTITFTAGDGHLYELKPVLKYGGLLVYNDTLNSNITLSDSMTIKSTATLTLNKVLTIAEDIYVEDGGLIETSLHGGIVLSGGAEMEFEDWSDGLVISQYGDHPKLYWSEHPTQEELVKYEIYRKKDSQSFQLIHTIMDKTVTQYEDTEVDIMLTPGANETSAHYYVRTVVLPSKSWIELDRTITVVLEHVEGNPQEKRSAEGTIITEYGLEQNHPNPFNPQTTITYQVPKTSYVKLTVYDILGKEVISLADEIKAMGRYTVTFDASQLASGTYIYTIEAGKFIESKKMILLK